MLKISLQLAVLLATALSFAQCPQDVSRLMDEVATNSLQSLYSLHDYVWVVEEHGSHRNRKGEIEQFDQRYQGVVAGGKMYTRTLQPGEAPSLPESQASLDSGYHVAPMLDGNCGRAPCGMIPYAFAVVMYLRDTWNVRQIQEGNLQGRSVLVVELEPKARHHSAYAPVSGTAWIDAERCRLLRLVVTMGRGGHAKGEETLEFGEVKGNWLPIRREMRALKTENEAEWGEEYTYLKFGASTRIVP